LFAFKIKKNLIKIKLHVKTGEGDVSETCRLAKSNPNRNDTWYQQRYWLTIPRQVLQSKGKKIRSGNNEYSQAWKPHRPFHSYKAQKNQEKSNSNTCPYYSDTFSLICQCPDLCVLPKGS